MFENDKSVSRTWK